MPSLADRMRAWFRPLHPRGPAAGYHGQFGQDQYLNEQIFKGRRDGVFVEIGSAEPVELNNTFFFEQALGWRGLLIEARQAACDRLARERDAEVVRACIGEKPGRGIFLDFGWLAGLAAYLGPAEYALIEKYNGRENEVKAAWVDVAPLSSILEARGLRRIDLLCLDTEGSEFAILKTIDFASVEIGVILCESNSEENRAQIAALLDGHGFAFHKLLGVDAVYLNRRLYGGAAPA
jgi:hypothetical protein